MAALLAIKNYVMLFINDWAGVMAEQANAMQIDDADLLWDWGREWFRNYAAGPETGAVDGSDYGLVTGSETGSEDGLEW